MITFYLWSTAILFTLFAIAAASKRDDSSLIQIAVFGPFATFAWCAVARWM